MKRIRNKVVFFSIGGIGYAVIELLWRRRTHWTMFLAGGICFMLFSVAAEKYKTRKLLFKCTWCALAVTTVELIFGLIFNLILGMNVWDYSRQPLNFLGQICPLYTLLWGVLSIPFIPLAETINKKLK